MVFRPQPPCGRAARPGRAHVAQRARPDRLSRRSSRERTAGDGRFRNVRGETREIALRHPEGLAAVGRMVTHVGPIARVMRERNGTPEDRETVLAAVLEEFAPFAGREDVAFPAAVNVFSGTRI